MTSTVSGSTDRSRRRRIGRLAQTVALCEYSRLPGVAPVAGGGEWKPMVL